MFGFVKELALIGQVSNTVGRMVKEYCGVDYIKDMSTKQQNSMAEETLKIVAQAQGKKIQEIDQSNFTDLMVVGFLMLANELDSNQTMKHHMVLMGLMGYLSQALEKNLTISTSILTTAKTYLENHRIS